jgi:electron transfer flavoprotein beta subunit
VATLRKALSMGADNAVHLLDDQLVGADLTLTAEVLSAALRRGQFDLVLAGNLSTDGSGGVLAAMVAEHLNVPQLSGLSTVSISESLVGGERATESGLAAVQAPLPAVVSVTEALPAARFPNFRGIMAAKKKPLETLTLAELGVDAADETAGRSIVIAVAERPVRAAGVKIVDDGAAAGQLLDFLVSNRLA